MKYSGQKDYTLEIGTLTRTLPIVEIEKGKLWIASFVMLGDTELNSYCAKMLAPRVNEEFDYLLVPEAKAIPLAQCICQSFSNPRDYVVLRKSKKSYMLEPRVTEVKSITTPLPQIMVLDGRDAVKITNKKVMLLDDVVSTGGTYSAMARLAKAEKAEITGACAVLKEGNFDISKIEKEIGVKIFHLQTLPIFTNENPD